MKNNLLLLLVLVTVTEPLSAMEKSNLTNLEEWVKESNNKLSNFMQENVFVKRIANCMKDSVHQPQTIFEERRLHEECLRTAIREYQLLSITCEILKKQLSKLKEQQN